jgi:hypothetical protein
MTDITRMGREKMSQTSAGAKSIQMRSVTKSTKTRSTTGIASESFKRILLDEGVSQSIAEQSMREVSEMSSTRNMNMSMLAATYHILITLGIRTYQDFISIISTPNTKEVFDAQLNEKISKMTPSDVSSEQDVIKADIYAEIIRYMYHIFQHRAHKEEIERRYLERLRTTTIVSPV